MEFKADTDLTGITVTLFNLMGKPTQRNPTIQETQALDMVLGTIPYDDTFEAKVYKKFIRLYPRIKICCEETNYTFVKLTEDKFLFGDDYEELCQVITYDQILDILKRNHINRVYVSLMNDEVTVYGEEDIIDDMIQIVSVKHSFVKSSKRPLPP
jgi:uncharacterized pyridoxamine 5'-phosphate oxidase family protein